MEYIEVYSVVRGHQLIGYLVRGQILQIRTNGAMAQLCQDVRGKPSWRNGSMKQCFSHCPPNADHPEHPVAGPKMINL